MQIKETHVGAMGDLKLKRDDGGWRHYIATPGGDIDLRCGTQVEIRLIHLDQSDEHDNFVYSWLRGRYEASLTRDPITARLVLGDFYPDEGVAELIIPLGARIRKAEKPNPSRPAKEGE